MKMLCWDDFLLSLEMDVVNNDNIVNDDSDDSDITIDESAEHELPELETYYIPETAKGLGEIPNMMTNDAMWNRSVYFVDNNWKFMTFLTCYKGHYPNYATVNHHRSTIRRFVEDVIHCHRKMKIDQLKEIFNNFDDILKLLPCLITELS